MNLQAAIDEEADDFRQALKAFGVQLSAEEADTFVDHAEKRMLDLFPRRDFETRHDFTPGLYARTIHMPAGSLLTSKIHKTEHQFVILVGSISVWTNHEGSVTLHAPYHGKTLPGTRRILFAHTDTVWTTFHPTMETDPEKLEEELIQKHVNPLLERSLT